MRIVFYVFIMLILLGCTKEEFSFQELLQFENPVFNQMIEEKDQYEIQIRYTQINRDEYNHPTLTSYDFNVDSNYYFYPASTVKMPVAFLALQRMKEIQKEGCVINLNSTMFHDSIRLTQTPAFMDSTSHSGLPNIGQYINKLFVVSDNDAYNRLYEFLGQEYINNELKQKNIFTNSRIITRVGVTGFNTEENKHTNPVRFHNQFDQLICRQEAKYAEDNLIEKLESTQKGKGFYSDELDSTIMKPFDMSAKNFINLKDLEAGLQRIIFPDLFSNSEQFHITDEEYQFLYHSMDQLPKDYDYLKTHTDFNYDGYVKLFMYGDTKDDIPDHIHIYNKVGFAYGYLTDCAYIFDTKNKIEFFLTATVHVNENQIYNDGQYEYDEKGIPFLAALGRKMYQRELQRDRNFEPNFEKFTKHISDK